MKLECGKFFQSTVWSGNPVSPWQMGSHLWVIRVPEAESNSIKLHWSRGSELAENWESFIFIQKWCGNLGAEQQLQHLILIILCFSVFCHIEGSFPLIESSIFYSESLKCIFSSSLTQPKCLIPLHKTFLIFQPKSKLLFKISQNLAYMSSTAL